VRSQAEETAEIVHSTAGKRPFSPGVLNCLGYVSFGLCL
jgi:hypothetical protein